MDHRVLALVPEAHRAENLLSGKFYADPDRIIFSAGGFLVPCARSRVKAGLGRKHEIATTSLRVITNHPIRSAGQLTGLRMAKWLQLALGCPPVERSAAIIAAPPPAAAP